MRYRLRPVTRTFSIPEIDAELVAVPATAADVLAMTESDTPDTLKSAGLILACVETTDGLPVFESVDEVLGLPMSAFSALMDAVSRVNGLGGNDPGEV